MTTTETTTSQELATAMADEQAAAEALAALEDAARAGEDVSPAGLSEAAGAVALRRLRREKLERDVTAAEADVAAAEREAAIDQLAADAAANAALDHKRLADLEAAALAAVSDYLAAVEGGHKAFRALVDRATAAGLVLAGKTDPRADLLVAGSVHHSGNRLRFGDPSAVRLRGVEYRPPAPRLAERFVQRVASLT